MDKEFVSDWDHKCKCGTVETGFRVSMDMYFCTASWNLVVAPPFVAYLDGIKEGIV